MNVQPASSHQALGQPSSVAPEEHRPVIVHEPRRGWVGFNGREIWHYRELLYFLTWRDIKVRYKQTIIGALWAILQPLLTMIAFAVVFGRLLSVPSNGVPYPVFAYAGLLPWTFFSAALTRASGSLIYDSNLLSKVYFPRLIVPTAAILALLADFAISFVILIGLVLVYDITPGLEIIVLPFFTVLVVATTLGASLWLAALNVKYRDVGYAVPFMMQFWLFVTPVLYPSSVVSPEWRWLLGLNPMAGVIEGFRWVIVGGHDISGTVIAVSIVTSLLLLSSGIIYFRRMEDGFADVV